MFMNFHEEFLHLKFFTLSADSEMIEFTLGHFLQLMDHES